jgi:phenylalanyl-tRNA synthetase beta chain
MKSDLHQTEQMQCRIMVLPEIFKAYLSLNKLKSTFNKLQAPVINGEGSHDFKLEVEDTELTPRYLGAVIEDIKVEESPSG